MTTKEKPLSNTSPLANLLFDEASIQILKERAKLLAKSPKKVQSKELTNSFVKFNLGDSESYGVPFQFVTEVLNNTSITKIPCTPDYIAGVVNHRGFLLTILDLKSFFNLETKSSLPEQNIIVIKSEKILLGLLVDTIKGDDLYQLSTLSPPLSAPDAIDSVYFIGLHQGVTPILDINMLTADLLDKLKGA